MKLLLPSSPAGQEMRRSSGNFWYRIGLRGERRHELRLWSSGTERRRRTCFVAGGGRMVFKDGVGLDGLRSASPPSSALSSLPASFSLLLLRSHWELGSQPVERSLIRGGLQSRGGFTCCRSLTPLCSSSRRGRWAPRFSIENRTKVRTCRPNGFSCIRSSITKLPFKIRV